MFKLALEKAEEPEIKLPTSAGSSKKEESSRKTSISALLTMPKPLIVWITIGIGGKKFGPYWGTGRGSEGSSKYGQACGIQAWRLLIRVSGLGWVERKSGGRP